VASEDAQDGYFAAWALVGENTGAQTLQLSWPADHWHDGGPSVSVVFLKGVDTNDSVRDSASDFNAGASASASVDTSVTDFIAALVLSVNPTPANGAPTGSHQVVLLDDYNYNFHYNDI